MKKISVVMPMLNSSKYLVECLDSVLTQSLPDLELICVDAGSTDGTLEILEQYSRKDKRLRIIHSSVKSYGYQVNLGIAESTGEYLSIVESDDFIKQDMYAALYAIAQKQSADIVKGDFCTFVGEGEDRRFTYRSLISDKKYYNRPIKPVQETFIFRAYLINPPGIYRLKFIKDNNIRLNETSGASFQDNGFWFQMFSLAEKVYLCDKAYYMVRRDNENSSFFSKGKVYAMCHEYDFIRDFLRLHPPIEAKLAPLCAYFRYGNYKFTLNRIADDKKLEFCHRFSSDFLKIQRDGELDRRLYSKNQLIELDMILRFPDKYYLTYYYDSTSPVRSLDDCFFRFQVFCYRLRVKVLYIFSKGRLSKVMRYLKTNGCIATLKKMQDVLFKQK